MPGEIARPSLPLGAGPGRRPGALACRSDRSRPVARRLPYRAIKWARRRPAAAGLVLMASVATAMAMRRNRLHLASQERRRQDGPGLARGEAKNRANLRRSWSNRANASSGWKRISTSRRSLPPTRLLRRTTRFRPSACWRHCPPRLRNWEWRHLNRRLHSRAADHPGPFGIRFAPTSGPTRRALNVALEALSGPIWDAAGGPKLRRMHGPDGTAYGVALDRAGIRMATAGSDGQVKVWDMTRGRVAPCLPRS